VTRMTPEQARLLGKRARRLADEHGLPNSFAPQELSADPAMAGRVLRRFWSEFMASLNDGREPLTAVYAHRRLALRRAEVAQ
jgi:hypothetical protein